MFLERCFVRQSSISCVSPACPKGDAFSHGYWPRPNCTPDSELTGASLSVYRRCFRQPLPAPCPTGKLLKIHSRSRDTPLRSEACPAGSQRKPLVSAKAFLSAKQTKFIKIKTTAENPAVVCYFLCFTSMYAKHMILSNPVKRYVR